MELHPAIYNDRSRSRRDDFDDDDPTALPVELDDVDLQELLLDDDALFAASLGGLRAPEDGASAAGAAAGMAASAAATAGGAGPASSALSSISAPIAAIRNFFFPASPPPARAPAPSPGHLPLDGADPAFLLQPTSQDPFVFGGAARGVPSFAPAASAPRSFAPTPYPAATPYDGGASPSAASRKRVALERTATGSFAALGAAAEAALGGWAEPLPPLEPPPPPAAAAPRAGTLGATGRTASARSALAATLTPGASGSEASGSGPLGPDVLVKPELLMDSTSNSEDFLRALNQSFLMSTENSSRRRLEQQRSAQRIERADEPYGNPPAGAP